MNLKSTRKIWKIIIIFVLCIVIVLIGLGIYWYLPLQRYTYSANGEKIFSIGYPVRFKSTIAQYGDFLDIGQVKSDNIHDNVLHFIYNSAQSTFNNEPDGSGDEISYSEIKNCDDLAKYDNYRKTEGHIAGYKSGTISGRTICYLNNNQTLDPVHTLGDIIFNPKPEGVLSVLYPKSNSFQAKLMLRSIKIYK